MRGAKSCISKNKDIVCKQLKCDLQCAEQQEPPCSVTNITLATTNNIPKCERNLWEKRWNVIDSVGATGVTLRHDQILPLPRKVTFQNNPKYERYFQTAETSFAVRGATGVPQHLQILRLPRKMAPQNIWKKYPENGRIVTYNGGGFRHDPNMIRAWADISHPPVRRGYLSETHFAWYNIQHFALQLSTLSHQMLQLPRRVTLQHHQRLRLPGLQHQKLTVQHQQVPHWPRKVTITPTSASAAPATKSSTELRLHWNILDWHVLDRTSNYSLTDLVTELFLGWTRILDGTVYKKKCYIDWAATWLN